VFSFVSQRVYVLLFIALALGTALGHYRPLPAALILADALLLAIVLVLLAALWWHWGRQRRPWAAVPGYLLVALTGYLNASIALSLPLNDSLRGYAGARELTVTGTAVSIPKYQRGHLRFMLRADHAQLGEGAAEPVTGQCYVYLKCAEPAELYFSDRVRLAASLTEVEPPRNRGQFDYRHYLLIRGTVLTAYAADPAQLERLNARPPPLWAGVARLRRWLTGSLAAGLPPGLDELAVSVVYGDKITDLPEPIEERFRRAGLTHILVASGTQVSLLIVLLALLCWRLPDDFSWRGLLLNLLQFGVTLAVVLTYACITGLETSILRALAMGVLVMAGRLAYRQVDGLTALAQSGLILLLLNPLQLLAPGFQLSFVATFGLIYVAGVGFPLVAHLGGWRRWLAHTLLTTGGAQLFVAPVLAAHFQQLSLWGLISNLLAIPLSFALLAVGGLASLGLAAIPLIGTLVNWLVLALTWTLDLVARVFAALPGSNVAVPHPPWWVLGAVYAFVFLLGEGIKLRGRMAPPLRLQLRLALPALGLAAAGWWLWWVLVPAPELSVLYLPYCEGYIWRSYGGRTVALLRASGLDRRHNLDTVTSALRWRGVNRLHGVIWLDGADSALVLPDYPAPAYEAEDDLPAGWDLAWLPGLSPSCDGLRLTLGRRELWLCWRERAKKSQLGSGPAGPPPPALGNALVIMNDRCFPDLPPDLQQQLQQRGEQLYLEVAAGKPASVGGARAVDRELTIGPAGLYN